MRRLFLLTLGVLCVIGCDDSVPEVDAGMEDAGPPPDAGPPFTCESAIDVMGVLDGTVSEMLDTTMIIEAPRDLGLACGNPDAEARWAPQAVIAFQVPATTGPVAVAFDTRNLVTPDNFNVVVQARETCELVPEVSFPSTCFEAVEAGREWRSAGAVPAMGGETIYFIVTGYADADSRAPGLIDRGPVQIDFTVQENRAPTLETAELVIIDNDLRVDVSGSDPEGNVTAVVVNFYGPDGLLDLYGTGAPTELNTLFAIPLTDPAPAGVAWTGGNWVRSVPDDRRTQLGEYLVAQGANMARVTALDTLNGASNALMVPLIDATIVGYGETCGGSTLCATGYDCGPMNTCVASADAIAQCAMATDAMLPAFTDQAVTVQLTGRTTPEQGLYDPLTGCVAAGESEGLEAVYRIDASSGTFDLLLSTDLPVTGRTDTFIYVRSDCGDPMTQLACNDDRVMGDPQSELEVRDLAPGTYHVFVEQVAAPRATAGNHALDITARPVLAMGAACDDAEVLNRCANGPCAASVCP